MNSNVGSRKSLMGNAYEEHEAMGRDYMNRDGGSRKSLMENAYEGHEAMRAD